MKFFELNNFQKVSRFCFGCEPLGGTDWGDDVSIKEISMAIEIAMDKGINFFDTADVYGLGLSETRLSDILSEKRHDMIIATKGGVSWKKISSSRAYTKINSSPEYIRAAVENSLKRLRIDKIPVYYIHKPEPGKDVGPAAQELNELKIDGKIGEIGCSNFSASNIIRALEFAPIRVLQNPVNIFNDRPDEEIIDICKKYNIRIVGYNVLASGLLTGKFDKNTSFPPSDRRSRLPHFIGDGLNESLKIVQELKKDAARNGMSLINYAVKGALDVSGVHATIIGIKSCAQLKENILVFS